MNNDSLEDNIEVHSMNHERNSRYIYSNESELRKWINEIPMTILYFSSNACGACSVIRQRIGEILKAYPKIQICDIQEGEDVHLAASWQVFSFPVLILLINGKETIRCGKNIDFISFENTIARYDSMIN